jgi:hypothetical protein
VIAADDGERALCIAIIAVTTKNVATENVATENEETLCRMTTRQTST